MESGTYREKRIYIEKGIADMFSLSQNQYATVKIVEKKQVILSLDYNEYNLDTRIEPIASHILC